ncbi:MAG: hypothetical protein WCS96_05765 [Victivallales bacterium]
MPTLNWIGKKAVENHHRQVPFHLLKDVTEQRIHRLIELIIGNSQGNLFDLVKDE